MESLAGRRVLVVEDEYFIADDLARALTGAGAIILGPFASHEEALALIETDQPDLTILDINLGGRATFVVADELARRDLPFIFASGYDASLIPTRHAHRPLWQKPYEVTAILEALAKRS